MSEQSKKRKWLKTLQFLAAYLVAAWTFLQFLEWILKRYDISPNWVDVFLWIFIGVIPSLLIYFHHQERINHGIIKLREKIIIPLNILLLAIVMYIGFGSSDLGATTKDVSFTNDQGNLETRTITKEEFRIGLPLFKFENKSQDTAYNWLNRGIPELLYHDIIQDKNMSPYLSDSEGTVNKVSESRIFNNYYLDGTFTVADSIFKITPTVRNAKNGRLIAEKTFESKDLLDLLDDISIFIRENVGLIEGQREFYIDLNLKEFYSPSLKAIRANIESNYLKAQEEDPNFAISYLEEAITSIRYSFGTEKEKYLVDQAFKNSTKLPLQKQLQIRIIRHIAYEEWETAEKLLKLQLEIDPSNSTYNNLLYTVYGETKQVEAYVNHAERRYNKHKNIVTGTDLLNASLLVGNYNEIITTIKNFELLQPNNPELGSFKLRPQLLKGDIEAAKKTQERTKLLHPNWKNFTSPYDEAIDYLSKHKIEASDLEKFVGFFRAQNSEQTSEYWINDGILLNYISNQEIRAPIVKGETSLILGSYTEKNANLVDFLTEGTSDFYGTKNTEHGYSQTNTYYYWRYDNSIATAEIALASDNLVQAKSLYDIAITKFPRHYFLQEAKQHLDFVEQTAKEELLKQFKSVSGQYGARRFWIDDGHFYYKRDGLAKIRIYPVSKDRYISLSKYGTQYGFETTPEGKMASTAYSYNNELSTWEKLMTEGNYLEKDN